MMQKNGKANELEVSLEHCYEDFKQFYRIGRYKWNAHYVSDPRIFKQYLKKYYTQDIVTIAAIDIYTRFKIQRERQL